MAEGMARLFQELGGDLRTSSPVEEIVVRRGRAKGVIVDGAFYPADAVVCAADFPYAMKHLVKDERARGSYTDEKIDSMDYSCSCFILYLGLDKQYPAESLHAIRFASDFKKNVTDIFDEGRFPDDPSFYLYAPSVIDPALAPEGMQGLYVLVPVACLPEEGADWSEEAVASFRERVLDLVERETAYDDVRDHIVYEKLYTPADFAERFNAYRGATFGLRPTLLQSNYWRPHNKAEHCKGLYFCGSSTHPGAGVPIVLLSARLAAEELRRDDRSRRKRAGAARRAAKASEGCMSGRNSSAAEGRASEAAALGKEGSR